jgi:AcrR family transcriptional regulator
MPKIVNYVDRVEGIREAVYLITLRDGVGAISLPAVAAELQMSARTIQRLLSSSEVLPRLGLQWAEMRARHRLINGRKPSPATPGAVRVLTALLETLPGHPDAEDRRVWWALVTAFEPTCEWAREARAEGDALLDARCEDVIEAAGIDGTCGETDRLRLLVEGAIAEIVRGRSSYDRAAALITEHVRRLGLPVEAGIVPGEAGSASSAA